MSSHGISAPQMIDAPLTRAATFLVLTVHDAPESIAAVRTALAGMGDLLKTVGFREPAGRLGCTVGIGARVWADLTGRPLPRELHPFREISGATHTAPATDGDVLLHIRADRPDLCYELERLLLSQLAGHVSTADETTGFRYFDARDLLGFVDGTANPVGPDLPEATLVGEEDPDVAGGSYVVVQKYTHPLAAWEALSAERQEEILGRRKIDDVELPDAEEGQKSHKTLTTIEDADGKHEILRDNMPFARPAAGEYGTYFIGYTRRLWVLERMLERMFIGDPPGLHDRLLDFSTARTGTTFFAPSAALLAALAQDPEPADEPAPEDAPAPPSRIDDHSLGLGSLRGPDDQR